MNEYKKRIFEARKQFISLNLSQEKELLKVYEDAGNKVLEKISQMSDSRTKIHNLETYKVLNDYRTELYNKLNQTITNNIQKSSDIQKGVHISFANMISPDKVTNQALKNSITNISNNTVKQLIAGEYYKDGKTLSKRLWRITGENANNINTLIKSNIAKGANVKELAEELEKYVNPKHRTEAKSFAAGIDSNRISYQAQRLARTSITHAQTETLIQNAKKNPFCKGLKWNLSASHSSRMHGRTDICDDYNGRVFKPEELPLQHPNCLCYMTEVIEDINKCIENMKAWSNGKKNKVIDEWIKDGDNSTSIKVSSPNAIQIKMDDNIINNNYNTNYMSNRFNPNFGVHDNIKLGNLSITMKKVENSKFDMWTGLEFTKENKEVRLFEKKLAAIKDKLLDGPEIPRIAIINFANVGLKARAVGAYNKDVDTIFINNTLNTEYKIRKYLTNYKGYFASTDTDALILHELGHKYHYDIVKLIAKEKNMSYNKAKEMFDNGISDYIFNQSSNASKIIKEQLSFYAFDSFYGIDRINEIMAEYFTVKDNKNKSALVEFISKYIGGILK